MAAAAAGPFSLREVLDAFRRCVTEQREVLLEPYLSGWRGLIRCFLSFRSSESFWLLFSPLTCFLPRTVLRLHRALRWLQLFLEGLRSGEPRTSVLCTDAYNASLAEHHPWVVRKAATVAFCTLPSRDAFLEIMNVGSAEEAVAVLGEAIPYIGDVYSITQELFAQHKLLDLP
ncbi:ceramide-1-phosphate transfer protein [Pyrgilauda ruficollis]|uniref:ceramide-1-phosphate transfer protein n=1 Tax=Pyrgilauda ruficollis TaxID=221976 RepID=UPI001B86EB4F|nr:ceramide-1-phosphate transfer protein [Pyrgilauda ruficollis]